MAGLVKRVAAFADEAATTVRECATLEEQLKSRSKMVMELKTSMQNATKLLDMLSKPALIPDLTELLAAEHDALRSMHQKLMDARKKVDAQRHMCKSVMRQLLSTSEKFLQVDQFEASLEHKDVQGVCYHELAPFEKTLGKCEKDIFSECVQATHTALRDADVRSFTDKWDDINLGSGKAPCQVTSQEQ